MLSGSPWMLCGGAEWNQEASQAIAVISGRDASDLNKMGSC